MSLLNPFCCLSYSLLVWNFDWKSNWSLSSAIIIFYLQVDDNEEDDNVDPNQALKELSEMHKKQQELAKEKEGDLAKFAALKGIFGYFSSVLFLIFFHLTFHTTNIVLIYLKLEKRTWKEKLNTMKWSRGRMKMLKVRRILSSWVFFFSPALFHYWRSFLGFIY